MCREGREDEKGAEGLYSWSLLSCRVFDSSERRGGDWREIGRLERRGAYADGISVQDAAGLEKGIERCEGVDCEL
jgi:hypothetical protein